ncbi:MAG: MAPEG family protein [Arenibacterium sp.]
MNDGRGTRIGLIAGVLWSVIVVFGGIRLGAGTFMPPPIALPGALIAPGLVLAAMIGRVAWAQGASDEQTSDSPAHMQHILRNSVELAVLALLVWPFVAVTLGGSVVLYMGLAFAVTRLAYWYGYNRSDYLRSFGFAATFLPTVLAGVWALIVWV